MKLEGKVIAVTGGGAGIGRALVRRFASEKPRALLVADRALAAAEAVAREVGGVAVACDCGREADVAALVALATERWGGVDLFCSNAGIGSGAGVEAPDDVWRNVWDVNVMAHVWAARALLPSAARPEGTYMLITASAAGLLSMIGDAAYTATKHAAVGLAEWLAIMYGDRGMRVSCLCPLFVNTDLLKAALTDAGGGSVFRSGTVIEPEAVAAAVVEGLESERFLILPHAEVAAYFQKKATDHDRWLGGMRKLKNG